MKTTHDCNECPLLKLMEKYFPPKRAWGYDNKNCMLNKETAYMPDDDDDDEDPDGFFMNTYYYDDDSYDDIPGFRD